MSVEANRIEANHIEANRIEAGRIEAGRIEANRIAECSFSSTPSEALQMRGGRLIGESYARSAVLGSRIVSQTF